MERKRPRAAAEGTDWVHILLNARVTGVIGRLARNSVDETTGYCTRVTGELRVCRADALR